MGRLIGIDQMVPHCWRGKDAGGWGWGWGWGVDSSPPRGGARRREIPDRVRLVSLAGVGLSRISIVMGRGIVAEAWRLRSRPQKRAALSFGLEGREGLGTGVEFAACPVLGKLWLLSDSWRSIPKAPILYPHSLKMPFGNYFDYAWLRHLKTHSHLFNFDSSETYHLKMALFNLQNVRHLFLTH
jgi:hypothetical protein